MSKSKQEQIPTALEIFKALSITAGPTIADEQKVFKALLRVLNLEEGDFVHDEFNNHFLVIGEPTVAFASHMDSIGGWSDSTVRVPVCTTDMDGRVWGHTLSGILGADDRGGMAIMAHMILRGIPGLYCFFSQEEKGRIGSEKCADSAEESQEIAGIPLKNITQMVSLDRRGYTSIITHQSSKRTASDVYCKALKAQLPPWYELDDGGSFTDSYSFREIIPECTNLSIGYFGAHSSSELQDMSYLAYLANQLCAVKWGELPIDRKAEEDTTPATSVKSYRWGDYDMYGGHGTTYMRKTSKRSTKSDVRPDSQKKTTSTVASNSTKKRGKLKKSTPQNGRAAISTDTGAGVLGHYALTLVQQITGKEIDLWSLEKEDLHELCDLVMDAFEFKPYTSVETLFRAGLLEKLVRSGIEVQKQGLARIVQKQRNPHD